MNDRIDRGHDFRRRSSPRPTSTRTGRGEIRLWHEAWLELAAPEIPHSVRLLRALRANGTPVFALSNFGIGTFALAEPEWPFLGEFDRRYISGHMGMAKPDADIFEAMEADCGVAPGAMLFTDDRADNIATAAARGWQTHHFDGPEGWARRLVAEGLLTEEAAR